MFLSTGYSQDKGIEAIYLNDTITGAKPSDQENFMTGSCGCVPNQNNRFLKIIMPLIFLCIWFSTATLPPLLASTSQNIKAPASDFPIYPSIKPNVEF